METHGFASNYHRRGTIAQGGKYIQLDSSCSTLEPRNQTDLKNMGRIGYGRGDHVSSKQIHGLFLRL